MSNGKQELQPLEKTRGSFLAGSVITLLLGLLLVIVGFIVPIGQTVFWNILIIAFGIPLAAGALAMIWKRSGKQSMVNGAKMTFIVGSVVAVGVIIWFVSVLNSLGS